MENEVQRVVKIGWSIPSQAKDGVRYISQDSDVSYPLGGLAVLGLEGGSGYWFEHRAQSVAGILAPLKISTMWEVGSGTGAMASRLVPPLSEVITVEPLAEGARAAAEMGLDAFCGTLEDLQLPDNSIECIGAFDVIEHISQVGPFLREVRRVLQPHGVVAVTVPAFGFLWGDDDEIAGHKRRYSRRSLIREFHSAGFTTMHTRYLFASLVPLAAITRAVPYRLGRRRTREQVMKRTRAHLVMPAYLDRLARTVFTAEAAVSRYIGLPFGLSLLGVFRPL